MSCRQVDLVNTSRRQLLNAGTLSGLLSGGLIDSTVFAIFCRSVVDDSEGELNELHQDDIGVLG
jgi:hypothetical protein